MPAAGREAEELRDLGKGLSRSGSAQSQSIELFKSSRAKVVSAPDESERDFRIRLQAEAREARDAALAKVREKYASKIDARCRIASARAEQAVQVQSEQATGAKMGAAVSIGATIFGALLGRKAISASTLGRATTAARGMGRVGKESQDVTRATENVTALKAQLSELEAGDAGRSAGGHRPIGICRTSRSSACSSSRSAAACRCNWSSLVWVP